MDLPNNAIPTEGPQAHAHGLWTTGNSVKFEQFRSRTLELLMGDEPLPHVLEALVRGLEQVHPGMLCSILLVAPDGLHLVHGAAPSLPDFYSAAVNGIAIGMGAGSCGTSAFTGARVVVENIATHPYWAPYRELAARAGLGACWSQPIRAASGRLLGTFAIYHRTTHAPTEADFFIIEQSARLASIAIEKSLAAQKLRDSEAHYRLLSEDVSDVVWKTTADHHFTYISPADQRMRGYAAHEIVGQHVTTLFTAEGIAANAARIRQHKEAKRDSEHSATMVFEVQQRCKDGALIWTEIVSSAERDAQGMVTGFHGITRNITERKAAEEKLTLAASVFTHAREGIMITKSDGAIIDVNEAFSRITGYSRDEVLGKDPRILSSGRQDKAFYTVLWRGLIEQGHWVGEVWNRRKDGEVYVQMQTISAVRDAKGTTQHYVALFSDITAQKQHQSQLEHIAHYDALTNLPNRVLLADRLRHGLAQAQRREQLLAVAFLDLDGFKAINDQHGHEAGDHMLISMASRMKQALRDGDTLARMGGDEFVAVLVDLSDMSATVPLLMRLLAAAAQPVQFGDLTLQVTASLGVTFYPQPDAVDADQLLRQADQSMYQAKQAGKNRYHVFDAEQDRSIRGHHESIERIRRALHQHEFVLHYQPKVNMRTGAVVGAEALIRWQHPERGLLHPGVFLPVIEDHPLAIQVGEWVIDTALVQIAQWQAMGLDVPVSVNIGARQLQQLNFVERLSQILADHPEVHPGDLELEVLETSALEDVAGVSRVIEACRGLGVMFALDDFGTGYSSLTYLKRLPVALLKIDQSFVHDMLDDPDDLAILEGVIGLASAFRRQVIAEGVETVEHGAMLLQLGCELAQGYGIARPMPADAFPEWRKTWRPDASWSNQHLVSRQDLPMLFASVEHRSWIKAMESHLRGERDNPPALDHRQCHFGQWLAGDGRTRHGGQPSFGQIDQLHQEAHLLAEELCLLKSQGLGPRAVARLDELHALGNTMLQVVQTLSNASRNQPAQPVKPC
jgi:diguanylate cyclase (GGDEF)-like protein/PAS domain S-box-containing protein